MKLLDTIKKIDNNLAVSFLLGDMRKLFLQVLRADRVLLSFSCNDSSGVTITGPTIPSRGHNIREPRRMDPIVFKAKDGRFGDGRRNINFKRNVIRSSSGKRG